MTPSVSVLIPVLNEAACIRETVAAMRRQTFDGELELLFIDGGSEDGTREILEGVAKEDPRVRVLDNPERRTPQALNLGLREAGGEVIVRMDAHTHYPDGYIERGIERLERGDVAHVSGPAIPEGADAWSRRVALALKTRLGTGGSAFRHLPDEEIEVDSGFAGLWWRSTLEAQGGWDDGWPINQDAELAARIRRDGGRLVCLPELEAKYIPRNSLRALARQYFRYGFYRVKTSRRHRGSLRRALLLPPALVLATVAALLPTPLAWIPRGLLAIYLLALAQVSAEAAEPGGRADAAALPAVFATMHLAWGAGFLVGCACFGPRRP